jgi:D-beta-D-heptose 7-phosphate kinase/D-beta-D-heptose 1-phosphate adenosyltransferase
MFREASKLGTTVVLINGNDFLMRKKGFIYQDEKDRYEIIESCKYVDYCFIYHDDTQFVVNGIRALQPAIFANGGDRTSETSACPEIKVCEELHIQALYNIGGSKIESSSNLIERLKCQ